MRGITNWSDLFRFWESVRCICQFSDVPIYREAVEREQSTLEWEQSSLEARRILAKIAGRTAL